MATRKPITTIEDDTCCPSPRAGVVADEDAPALARSFAALGDPVRVQIVSLLAAAPDGEVCACDFVGPTGKSQPTVSHHLKILAEAGLITGEKRGRWIWYSLLPDGLDQLQGTLRRLQPPAPRARGTRRSAS